MSSNRQEAFCKYADVVVIGGGVIGTAVAYFLARAGIQTCLLERGDIASGTSSAAAVAALLQTKTSAVKLALADKSLTLLDELQETLDPSFEYEHSGSLLVANNADEMAVVRDMAGTLRTLGLDVQLVGGQEAHAIMPLLGDGIVGASFSPRDALLNPLSLVTAYATAARRLGAVICTFTEVTDIEVAGDKITAVQTNKGRVLTNTVVNAAGVWSPHIANMVGVDLPVTPLKGELLITEPMPPMMQGTLIAAKYLLSKRKLEQTAVADTPQRSVGITLAQVARGNFVVGSTREQAGFDRRSSFGGIQEQCRQLLQLTPALADVHLLRAYAGLRPISPDGLPIIGRVPQLPGMIVAAGFGGDGLALSAVTGELVLNIMQGKADAAETAALSIGRFASHEALS
ncbi:MAG: FAD-binding oxidoreductase [Chloroflexi bacterium]|nr:FAD-binding oxidoreductase [Chloroflexota bacterium]